MQGTRVDGCRLRSGAHAVAVRWGRSVGRGTLLQRGHVEGDGGHAAGERGGGSVQFPGRDGGGGGVPGQVVNGSNAFSNFFRLFLLTGGLTRTKREREEEEVSSKLRVLCIDGPF